MSTFQQCSGCAENAGPENAEQDQIAGHEIQLDIKLADQTAEHEIAGRGIYPYTWGAIAPIKIGKPVC